MNDFLIGFLTLASVGLFFYLIYALFDLVGMMARDRGHNPWPWWLLSLAWSPFATIAILWVFFPLDDEDDANTQL